jgi:hypothetical protein
MLEAYVQTPQGLLRTVHGRLIDVESDRYAWIVENKRFVGDVPIDSFKPVCKCCGKVICLTEAEMFEHKEDEGEDCPAFLAQQHPFDPVFRNAFDVSELERNLEALDLWRERNQQQTSSLMQRITGEKTLSPTDRLSLKKTEDSVRCLKGLAEYPWALPFIVVPLAGSRPRAGTGASYIWRGEGVQALPAKTAEGSDCTVYLPKALRLCFDNNGHFKSVLNQGKGIEIGVEPPSTEDKPIPLLAPRGVSANVADTWGKRRRHKGMPCNFG